MQYDLDAHMAVSVGEETTAGYEQAVFYDRRLLPPGGVPLLWTAVLAGKQNSSIRANFSFSTIACLSNNATEGANRAKFSAGPSWPHRCFARVN
jgi:hypothetical protein